MNWYCIMTPIAWLNNNALHQISCCLSNNEVNCPLGEKQGIFIIDIEKLF